MGMARFPTMDDFAKRVAEKALDEYECEGKTLRQWLLAIAGGEAVHVVRCKDCTQWMYEYDDVGLCVTDVPDVDGVQRRADDFCSYGERKDNGKID